jgi:quinol monooxygenase YgiN
MISITGEQKLRRDIACALLIGVALMVGAFCERGVAQDMKGRYSQIAEIEIDPAQLEAYKAAVREHIEAAVREEPGVLSLQAVSEKDDPTRIRVFEVYADPEAYRSHLETPHFKKYKAVTETMVRSLKLVRTVPIALATK